MELATKYKPSEIEDKWYSKWMDNKLFHSEPDEREPYTIVIPPPNVTGKLHMGHMLNNTIQDVLIRRARMLGKNACWVPGMDHASIATEAKVVAMLKEKGINKDDLTREEFLEYAWEWKEKYGGIILNQLKKLGCSCDWERTRFTMEPDLYDSVLDIFTKLYKDGYIYRGLRMVNWDPEGKTALSDEEVFHKEVNSKLYYLKYQIKGEDDKYITIATTRPETILGDTAICVHPDDERYLDLQGKTAIVPILNREIPIITDTYVTPEFGTGALKVTPAHDENDFTLGEKHDLDIIDIFNDDASLNENAGHLIGENRFVARKKIAKELEELGILLKTEDLINKIGYSERTHAVIEPRLSRQWFVNMKLFMKDHPEILDNVMDHTIQFHPAKFGNTYRHWLENIKDWCISRQLIWGQQIPAWYTNDGKIFVAKNAELALEKAQAEIGSHITASDLKQDDDVFDTWFSSWIWPISVFDGITKPDNDEINYYYPTNDLVTAPDIIFFWVARMIMAGYKLKGVQPFKNVYFTGIVRDKQRRKMSKQLGNSPDPIELMAKYGTDGVRMGLLLSAPAGNDLLFDESLCEQGRNFSNKIWNAFRLVKGWDIGNNDDIFYRESSDLAHQWMEDKINTSIVQIEKNFEQFRLSDAIMNLYKLVWDDFCSWYLEMLKPKFGDTIPLADFNRVQANFEKLLLMLHPYMPFITEHLWQNLSDRENSFINQQSWPKNTGTEAVDADSALELIRQIRAMRNNMGLSPKISVELHITSSTAANYQRFEGIIGKLANVESFNYKAGTGSKILIGTDEITINFIGVEDKGVDKEEIEKELKRLKGFLFGIEKKLSNTNFVANAKPEVVEKERQKKADTEQKIASLETELGG
jgi:valyl-tRNA synthetase